MFLTLSLNRPQPGLATVVVARNVLNVIKQQHHKYLIVQKLVVKKGNIIIHHAEILTT